MHLNGCFCCHHTVFWSLMRLLCAVATIWKNDLLCAEFFFGGCCFLPILFKNLFFENFTYNVLWSYPPLYTSAASPGRFRHGLRTWDFTPQELPQQRLLLFPATTSWIPSCWLNSTPRTETQVFIISSPVPSQLIFYSSKSRPTFENSTQERIWSHFQRKKIVD